MRIYNSYSFTDKDPVIDELRDVMERESVTVVELAEMSGVSYSAIIGWLYGKVKRPQHATLEACMRSMGYRSVYVKDRNVVNWHRRSVA